MKKYSRKLAALLIVSLLITTNAASAYAFFPASQSQEPLQLMRATDSDAADRFDSNNFDESLEDIDDLVNEEETRFSLSDRENI